MIHLIIGGSGSGKSEYAENLAISLLSEASKGESKEQVQEATQASGLYYLATMECYGEEGKRRVARHRKLREGKGFETLEVSKNFEASPLLQSSLDGPHKKEGVLLLEDLPNLAANELFSPDSASVCDKAAQLGSEKDQETHPFSHLQHIQQELEWLFARVEHVLLVSGNVDADGVIYEGDLQEYLKLLSQLHRWLGQRADCITEVVCGIPVKVKE